MKIRISTKSYTGTVEVKWTKYQTGQNALLLGPGVFTASVCLPEFTLGEDEVFIKNWSENEGVMEALVAHKIISPPIGEYPAGHCWATKHKIKPICRTCENVGETAGHYGVHWGSCDSCDHGEYQWIHWLGSETIGGAQLALCLKHYNEQCPSGEKWE